MRKKIKNNGVKIFNDIDSATLHVIANYFIKCSLFINFVSGSFI